MHCFASVLALGIALPEVFSAPSASPLVNFARSDDVVYPPQPPGTGPGKRGLVYNSHSKVGWSDFFINSKYVTYGSNGQVDRGDEIDDSFAYVPTIVVDGNLHNGEWNDLVPILIEGGAKVLFASNEPDSASGANLSPAQAVTVYLNYLQPYYGTVQLGTPAVSGTTAGLTFLDKFVSLCTACDFNFVNVNYVIDRSDMDVSEYIQSLKDFIDVSVPAIQKKHSSITGLPIAIGEFWLTGASSDEAGDLMNGILPWLDDNDLVLFYQAGGLFEKEFLNAAGTGWTAAATAYNSLGP